MARRIFTLSGADRVVYDDDSEEWYLNGDVEGRMSAMLAADICHALSMANYELHGEQPELDPKWPTQPESDDK